jgi:hypothetical protein
MGKEDDTSCCHHRALLLRFSGAEAWYCHSRLLTYFLQPLGSLRGLDWLTPGRLFPRVFQDYYLPDGEDLMPSLLPGGF